jgi:DNA/RNA-binding domain of Phe-tRNA-synthetase-like protein
MREFEPLVDSEIWARYPEYRALSVVIWGYEPERAVEAPIGGPAPWTDGHVQAWHEAFKRFGANPKRTAPSFDALVKRFRKDGLPAIYPLVDCYNALSVQYGAPFGGEDIDRYVGVPRLVFADGTEGFDTSKDGQPVVEHPEAGEVIWRDEAGVTCRRWNWRQCKRTAITESSRNLWFVIDRLPPMRVEDLEAAGAALVAALMAASPGAVASVRLLAP